MQRILCRQTRVHRKGAAGRKDGDNKHNIMAAEKAAEKAVAGHETVSRQVELWWWTDADKTLVANTGAKYGCGDRVMQQPQAQSR